MTAAVDVSAPAVVDLARVVSRALGWTYLDALDWSRDLAAAQYDVALMLRALSGAVALRTEMDALGAYERQRRLEAEEAAASMLGDPLYFTKAREAAEAVRRGLNARLSPDEIALAVVARLKGVEGR